MYAIIFHAHQKIDRVAARLLSEVVDTKEIFPSAHSILYFEGKRGPDAVFAGFGARVQETTGYGASRDRDAPQNPAS